MIWGEYSLENFLSRNVNFTSFDLSQLRSSNKVKFTEECLISAEKHVLLKIKFNNGINMICYDEPESNR